VAIRFDEPPPKPPPINPHILLTAVSDHRVLIDEPLAGAPERRGSMRKEVAQRSRLGNCRAMTDADSGLPVSRKAAAPRISLDTGHLTRSACG
jgi:hypothetical protein